MNKPRILSVDDEPSFVDMLKQYFEIRGYVIDVTSEGEEGLRLLSLGKYDVVLLDLKMAGLSGDKIMDEIKKQKLDTKIIFISAYSDSGKTKERLMNEGAYAYLMKPLNIEELRLILRRAIENTFLLIQAGQDSLQKGPWRHLNALPERGMMHDLSNKWSLKGADLWHLATAKGLKGQLPELSLFTFDRRLLKAAEGEELSIGQ